ncbi:pyridoxamine 5'-phosphate oxidase family protein [Knoellia sp. CPCC 206453]|uniref:pyridoxamine 5'-phosphate oxidase family protein n=1 Tax=Knoellia pratensis TaxID=3404796 RepID=UPI0036090CDF
MNTNQPQTEAHSVSAVGGVGAVGTGSTEVPESTHSIAPRESWDLLRGAVVGRLAVVHDDVPDIFPVNYVVDHGTVVLRTAGGTKHAAARNRVVAFEVDGCDLDSAMAWSVVLRGRATEVYAVDEAIKIMHLPLLPWSPGSKPHLLRITPDSITGRRFALSGE